MPPTYLESPPNELNKLPPIDGNPGKEFVKKEPLFSPKIIKTLDHALNNITNHVMMPC
jgi:hypothetical protein